MAGPRLANSVAQQPYQFKPAIPLAIPWAAWIFASTAPNILYANVWTHLLRHVWGVEQLLLNSCAASVRCLVEGFRFAVFASISISSLQLQLRVQQLSLRSCLLLFILYHIQWDRILMHCAQCRWTFPMRLMMLFYLNINLLLTALIFRSHAVDI